MLTRFGTGTPVDYAGARWRVQRALGVEAVLLRSDSGEEVSADPLKISLAEVSVAIGPPLRSSMSYVTVRPIGPRHAPARQACRLWRSSSPGSPPVFTVRGHATAAVQLWQLAA